MRTWRRRLATAPPWAFFLYFTIAFAVLGAAMNWLLSEQSSVTGWLVGVLGYGVLMTAWLIHRRRRDGGAERALQVGLAIKEGRLPDDPDPGFWGPALARQERTFRRLRWIAPVEFGAFAALAVWLALARNAIWWAFVGLLITMGTLGGLSSRRSLRRVLRMRDELTEAGAPIQ